ncbi:hypothetical protein QE386_002065 [Pseudoxanthomonas winnipegensis]|nr:hypothetical protein [Pseudoxanthomonas winnipegensis]
MRASQRSISASPRGPTWALSASQTCVPAGVPSSSAPRQASSA